MTGLSEGGLSGDVSVGAGTKKVFKVIRLNEFTKARVLCLLTVHFFFISEDLLVGQDSASVSSAL